MTWLPSPGHGASAEREGRACERVRPARAGVGCALASTLLAAVLLAAGCTVISDQNMVVSAGEISDVWEVRWNPALGTPAMMTNRSLQDVYVDRNTPAISDTAGEEAVRAVLRANPDWFPLRPGKDQMVVVGSRAAGWLRQVDLQQYYRGIPVAGARYEARVFPNGRVGSIEGLFRPDIELVVTPAVNEQLAESRARALLVNGRFPPEIPVMGFRTERVYDRNNALAIVPVGDDLKLAWAIMIQNAPDQRARVYIDAESGEVMGRQLVTGNWMR